MYEPKKIASIPDTIWIRPAATIFSIEAKDTEMPAMKETVVTIPVSIV